MLTDQHAAGIEAKRGISRTTLELFGVVSHPHTDAIGFEYRSRQDLQFTKWRGKGKSMWIEPTGIKPILWNIDSLRGSSAPEMVIITEGEFDALSWLEVEATAVVSVPTGAPSKPGEGDIFPADDDKFAYLWNGNRIIPELDRAHRIILAADADKPGQILSQELAIRLGKERCWVVQYPDGCKDTNDVLVKHGHEAVLSLLDTARPLWPTEMVPVMDLPDDPFSVAHNTGWHGFDEHLKLVPPELMITTGKPNSGKSEFAWALACQAARIHGWKIGIIQFEDRSDRIKRTLMGYATAWKAELDEAPEEWVRKHFYAPLPESSHDINQETSRCMNWVLDRIKECGKRHGCRMVIIDPWNEIEHDWTRQYTETQYISRMLKLMKQEARRYSLVINLVAHPTKAASGNTDIGDASLADVSGGAAWDAKADHGLVVARDDSGTNHSLVKVSKSRDWETMGRPGVSRFQLDPHSRLFRYVGGY